MLLLTILATPVVCSDNHGSSITVSGENIYQKDNPLQNWRHELSNQEREKKRNLKTNLNSRYVSALAPAFVDRTVDVRLTATLLPVTLLARDSSCPRRSCQYNYDV